MQRKASEFITFLSVTILGAFKVLYMAGSPCKHFQLISLSLVSFFHSFNIQQIFPECLLCLRCYSKLWGSRPPKALLSIGQQSSGGIPSRNKRLNAATEKTSEDVSAMKKIKSGATGVLWGCFRWSEIPNRKRYRGRDFQREKLVQRAHGGNNYSGLKDPTGWSCGWSTVGIGQCGKSWGPRGKQRPDGAGLHQLQ